MSMPRQNAPADFVSYYKILDVGEIYAKPAKTFAASTLPEIHAFLFCKRLQMLRALGPNAGKQRRSMRLNDVFISHTDFQNIKHVFELWPAGLHEFLERHLGHARECPSIYLLSGPLTGKGKLPLIKSGARIWSFRHHVLQKPGLKAPQTVQSGSQNTVGIKYLIESTGCTYDTARYWIESGRLGLCAITTQLDGTQRYQIDKTRVQKAIQISKSTASIAEMAQTLGTSNSVIRSLVKTNFLHAVPYGRAPYNIRVHPAEVFALANKLFLLARRRRNLTNDQLLLTTVVRRFIRRPAPVLQAFVCALFEGEIAINKTETHVARLDEILIDFESLLEWERLNLP